MYRIRIEDLEFYGYHGVPAEERHIGHRYIANVDLTVDGKADVTDSINDTVDYGAVGKLVEREGKKSQHHTLEKVAADIADAILEQFPMVYEVTLDLVKPLPPSNMIAGAAGVEITRSR